MGMTLINQVEQAHYHLLTAEKDDRPVVAFAHRREAVRLLKAATKAIESDLVAADESVQNYLLEQGVASLKLADPPVTLFIEHRPYMSINYELWGDDTNAGNERAAAALEAAGLGEFARVRVNLRGLTSHFREQLQDEGEEAINKRLEAELRGMLKLGVTTKVKTLRAG